jgi:hypothetical protein
LIEGDLAVQGTVPVKGFQAFADVCAFLPHGGQNVFGQGCQVFMSHDRGAFVALHGIPPTNSFFINYSSLMPSLLRNLYGYAKIIAAERKPGNARLTA